MINEEKAKEYAQTECCNSCTDSCKKNKCKMYCNVANAVLYGLAEGRKEKWHKVAYGDYPPCDKGNYTINVLTDRGDIAYYNYDLDCWIAEPSSAEIDTPVAWCEIPKYEG